jgi:GTP-binding protein LepA
MKNIRNFCIIAHIDHGKSTLADRLLEITATVQKREMQNQLLDTMDLERERGITIKLCPVRMQWKGHILNLIDTPGHVDFTYEVSRSLAACEGAILVVDASQGIEAQTLANVYLALEQNLEIIPVLNKIDLPAADPEARAKEMENILGIKKEDIICISAKTGKNVEEVLDRVIARVPSPRIPKELEEKNINLDQIDKAETKALVFDSAYDIYRGVVSYVRVFQGSLKKGDAAYFLSTQKRIDITEVGFFRPKFSTADEIKAGEVGYVVTALKKVGDAQVGDTLWKSGSDNQDIAKAHILPGYKKVTPFVYASIFTVEADDYNDLRDSLEKLSLNDSSLAYTPERSTALGFGFRCGFLGLLHMEIVQERLEREYNLNLIITAPSVSYKVVMSNTHEVVDISNPSDLPKIEMIEEIHEPWAKVELMTPSEYIGALIELCSKRRGSYKNMSYVDEKRVIISFEMPMSAIIVDFYDVIKSITSGYVSMSYEFLEFRPGDLVKMDIMVAGEVVGPLSQIIHRTEAQEAGGSICRKLKDIIPKKQFVIAIQAAIGGKIIARESISAMRKDVTGYLYGGDVSRKKKLLEKQKKGKKRMKSMGKIDLPQEAFLAVLKKD